MLIYLGVGLGRVESAESTEMADARTRAGV
jgi:hypothetical protein